MVEARREEEGARIEERTHSHQTNDAVSEPVPRLPRRAGKGQLINWLKLFQEVEAGESCIAVADRYRAGGHARRQTRCRSGSRGGGQQRRGKTRRR